MFGRKKNCTGCHGGLDEKTDKYAKFKIMYIKSTRDYVSGKPQRVRKEAGALQLHQKCLPEHIWKVDKYVAGCSEFADVEVETSVDGESIKYQMIPGDSGGWRFKGYKEGGRLRDFQGLFINKDMDKLLKRMIDLRDLCFVVFKKGDRLSPAVLLSSKDPAVSSKTSSPEYVKLLDEAARKYREECQEAKEVSKDAKALMLGAAMTYASSVAIVFDS